jgi:FdhE protein
VPASRREDTLFPALASLAESLEGLRAAGAWDRGYCPTCGGWPVLGEFRGLEQVRYLRCGLCASGWEFPRLRCAYCGGADHRHLGYFHAEGEEGRYRAGTCDACRGYVKMVSTLAPLTGPALLVADLATVHLDLVAVERGFVAPGGNA